MKRFNTLDGFRGLSAICVVIYHIHSLNSIGEFKFFRSSYLMVNFFFVLSGFVISHAYAYKVSISFREFILARTLRLFPLHVFMLMVWFSLEIFKYKAYYKYNFNFNSIPFSGATALSEFFPNLFLLQSWLPNTEQLSWNYTSWSISIEYYTYLIFFLTILFKHSIKYYLWVLILSLLFFIKYFNCGLRDSIIMGLSCFFAGAVTYSIFRVLCTKIVINTFLASILETSLILFTILLVSYNVNHREYYAIILFCIFIFLFALEKGCISNLLKHNFFTFLGKLSYSIYLTHSAVLFVFLSLYIIIQKKFHIQTNIIIDKIRFVDFGSPLYNNLLILFVLIIVITCSNYTYMHIERNGQKFCSRLKNKKG